MCPLWPLNIFVLYILLVCPIWLIFSGVATAAASATWKAQFFPSQVEKLEEEATQLVSFFIPDAQQVGFPPTQLQIIPADCQIADVIGDKTIYLNSTVQNTSFLISGKFLGYTSFKIRASSENDDKNSDSDDLVVSVIRRPRAIDKIFVISVAVLVGLNYINMGCSLDLDVVKTTLKKPVGPAVGLVSQYLFLPLMSFGLAHLIFKSPNMRLGMFTLGCSPGGGASNMWTYLLGGNLNLSITMTFLSNVLAFAAMPIWLITLGSQIFESSRIKIPYTNIMSSVVIIVIPVAIGLLIQRYFPRVSAVCRRLLGPCCLFMIIFIVIFGIFANLYMFKLFEWRVVISGLSVCWSGFAFGALLAKIFRFSFEDVVAVSIETGVQNTGITIILLLFSLPQPDADLTSVIPVAAAVMTPLPLVAMLLLTRFSKWRRRDKSYTTCVEANGTMSPDDVSKVVENGKDIASKC